MYNRVHGGRAGGLAALPIFALWLFTWCTFFGCSRQVVVTEELDQSDSVETHIVRVSEIEGTVPDIGQSLSIPNIDFHMTRVSDSLVIVRTPVRTDTRTFVRNVSPPWTRGKTIIKNAFNSDSYNKEDINNKRAIQDSPESGNRLKKSQHRSQDSGNRSKQVDKQATNFPWWWWLILVVLGVGGWVLRKYKRNLIGKWLK